MTQIVYFFFTWQTENSLLTNVGTGVHFSFYLPESRRWPATG